MIMRRLVVTIASLFFGGLAGVTAGCGEVCEHLSAPPPDPDAKPDPITLLPTAYLWVGPKDVAPPCPPGAPIPLFEAYADMTAALHKCPACACGPSETTCKGPLGWDAVAAPCADTAGASAVPFDAPENWNGICSTTAKIQADKMCAGSIPCAQSVIVQPPQATGEACKPMTVGEGTRPEPDWMTLARGCQVDFSDTPEPGECNVKYDSTGFYRLCKRLENPTDECPGEYSDRHELFHSSTDERTCSPCTCGTPQGGACTVKVGAFSDEDCGSQAGSAYASSDGPAICFDVPDGTALLGKTSESATSSPGECAPSGGEPMGQVIPAQPVTWCCYVSS